VIAVDREKFNDEDVLGPADFTFHRMDLFAYLFGPIPEVDVVVPLQGQIGSVDSVKNPMGSLRDSLTSNRFLLDRLVESGQKPLVVFVSSDLCYRDVSRCVYSLHKKTVEGYLKIASQVHGIPHVILRTGTAYGPLQKRQSVVNFYIGRALEGKTIPVYGTGDNRQAFLYIDDCVECVRMACEGLFKQNRTYPLFSENLRIVDIAKTVSEMLGGEVEHVDFPSLAKAVNVGDLPITLPLPEGWKPKVMLGDGIERTAEWMKGEEDAGRNS